MRTNLTTDDVSLEQASMKDIIHSSPPPPTCTYIPISDIVYNDLEWLFLLTNFVQFDSNNYLRLNSNLLN